MKDLHLSHLTILHPRDKRYPLGDRVSVIPLATLATNPGAIYGA
jgi:hypothetical protein